MTITHDDEFEGLKAVGAITARTLAEMTRRLEPGMTTAELDAIGRALLEAEGARPAPELTYGFPGATCISVNEEIAHGVPGPRVLARGDLVNIDVSAEKDGYFADTGASAVVPPARAVLTKLCRDGRRAMMAGVAEVGAGRPLAGIGRAVGRFAQAKGYTLIKNLASHGLGRALHEDPTEIPTWPDRSERRVIGAGLVLTVEPFLSLGGEWADQGGDEWTLLSYPAAPTVQYEHTVVATKNGPVILTRAS